MQLGNITAELAICADYMKRDMKYAEVPCRHERLRQYVKEEGPEKQWCPVCYIDKDLWEQSNPFFEEWYPAIMSGKQYTLHKCGNCGTAVLANRHDTPIAAEG